MKSVHFQRCYFVPFVLLMRIVKTRFHDAWQAGLDLLAGFAAWVVDGAELDVGCRAGGQCIGVDLLACCDCGCIDRAHGLPRSLT
jgi:hypothetical protein